MKIAICFTGFLRSFQFTCKSWNYRLKNIDNDVYVYSPNTYYSLSSENSYDSKPEEYVDECYIRQIFGDRLKKINLYNYSPDIYKSIVSNLNIPEENFLKQKAYRIFSFMFNIQNCLNLIEDINNYDFVILTRPDIILYDYLNFDVLDPNKINFPYFHGVDDFGNLKNGVAAVFGTNRSFNDQVFIGTPKNMSIFKNIFDLIGEYHNQNIIINAETLLGHHCLKNNIDFGPSDFIKYDLLRFAKQ